MRLTEIAADKIKEVLAEKENSENLMLRVEVEGFGWGGPKLRLTLDELKSEHDKEVKSHGVSVIYNSGIEEYLSGLTIDYEDSMMQRGFVIRGNEYSSCWW